MDLLATVLATAAALELFGALVFAFTQLRRPSEREFGFAGAISVAAAVHAVGGSLGAAASSSAQSLRDDEIAWLGLLLILPLAVHYVAAAHGDHAPRRLLAGAYAVTAALGGLDLAGRLRVDAATSTVLARAFEPGHPLPALAPLGLVAFLSPIAGAGWVLVSLARAYLAGRRDALTLVIGATVLLATAVNDLGGAAGLLRTGALLDAGLVAFVVALASTPSARYAAVKDELERRTRDLRARTRELRRSYEELRAAQEELVKKEQLAVVGELAAVIAHEVRNPLAIIGNAVAGLRKPVISREDHVTLLTILDEEAVRLNRLVSDLLAYARPVSPQRQQISIADLLERALGLIDAPHRSIRVELKVECSEGRIFGDANLLRQVFDNLVDNAAQAMGTGGTLTVRLRAATEDGSDGIAVDIADTGEGMDTQVRSRARDPFFTTRPSGTGLGLAIVDRIVSAHGGHFTIESRAGEGTTVTVFLPHGSASEPPPRSRSIARVGSDPPRSEV